MMHLPRIMLAAPASGSGKTMITSGILQSFVERGLAPAAFKCGPDYIDPMFHSKVIGAKSRNLDTFFTDEKVTRMLFAKTASGAGISVLEGVMGIYDGLGGITSRASSYELAAVTDTPVILIVNARGMSLSVIAMIQGFLDYQKRLGRPVIRGVILNQMSRMTYQLLKKQIEEQTGIRVLGYVPRLTGCTLESRHLGLVTPDEISGLQQTLKNLSAELEQCLDIEGILALAQEAPDYADAEVQLPDAVRSLAAECRAAAVQKAPLPGEVETAQKAQLPSEDETAQRLLLQGDAGAVRIGVAQDEAFCFYYQDNLELLKLFGAELVPFSPLHDAQLPKKLSGLLLGGGYPELYAKQLSENEPMKCQIREALAGGMPYLAECGGFMYLHEEMEDMEGTPYPMCAVMAGRAFHTPKLSRFGYITLTAGPDTEEQQPAAGSGTEEHQPAAGSGIKEQQLAAGLGTEEHQLAAGSGTEAQQQLLGVGEEIRGHEFHYFDSTDPGEDYTAKKPIGSRSWNCIHGSGTHAAGYPHLYYWSNPRFAAAFVREAAEYARKRAGGI